MTPGRLTLRTSSIQFSYGFTVALQFSVFKGCIGCIGNEGVNVSLNLYMHIRAIQVGTGSSVQNSHHVFKLLMFDVKY